MPASYDLRVAFSQYDRGRFACPAARASDYDDLPFIFSIVGRPHHVLFQELAESTGYFLRLV